MSVKPLRRFGLPAALLLVGVAGFLLLRSMKAAPAREDRLEARPLISAESLDAGTPQFEIHVDGTVVPKREVEVAAEVRGQIIEKSPQCKAGNFVREGTLLLRIDPRHYELEERRLQSLADQAQIDLDQLEIERANTLALADIAEREFALKSRELERFDELISRGATSEGERDRVEADALTAETTLRRLENDQRLIPARVERAQAALELAEAQLAQARLDLEKTEIRAAIDGVVTLDPVESRQFVTPGMKLVAIEDTSVVEVACHLRADDLYWLWSSVERRDYGTEQDRDSFYEVPAAEATITYRIGERSYNWHGQLARYEGIGISEHTRTVPCRIEVSQPLREADDTGPPALMRGMFVEICLHVSPKVPLLRLPSAAVQPNEQVWTVSEGQLHVHRPKIAKVLADSVLVAVESTDLKPGDRLVVTPLSVASDGMAVREHVAR